MYVLQKEQFHYCYVNRINLVWNILEDIDINIETAMFWRGLMI